MSDRVPATNAVQTVAAHPPLSVAITTIGVIAPRTATPLTMRLPAGLRIVRS
jgi:hypothetical protein